MGVLGVCVFGDIDFNSLVLHDDCLLELLIDSFDEVHHIFKFLFVCFEFVEFVEVCFVYLAGEDLSYSLAIEIYSLLLFTLVLATHL